MIDLANYSEVELSIFPSVKAETYDFVVKNCGAKTLWGVELQTYEILGPGHFGLDDTHMPKSLTHEPITRIERLNPMSEATFTLKKWGDLERYKGPASGAIYALCSSSEACTARTGIRVPFTVFASVGRPFNVARSQSVDPTRPRQAVARSRGDLFRWFTSKL